MIGISIKPHIGIGDQLQFSSLPENYWRATGGRKLYDISRPWFFDHNPYVSREPGIIPVQAIELWNFGPQQWEWPQPRDRKSNCYLSNAEIWASRFNVGVTLNRPRLYKFEDCDLNKRELILLHVDGRSHGLMPDHIIEHVLTKYKDFPVYQIGNQDAPSIGVPKIITRDLWELAHAISGCRMLIGVDSGPSWIGAAYPDVQVKTVRLKPSPEFLENWTPLEITNIHAHWDDRCRQIYNPSEHDVGFTSSYKKI